jgi:uncharacterized damage-inducible protein DinB
MESITESLKIEVLRRINEESIPKILDCLLVLQEDELYFRPNENCNSINNLIIHLNGNVRQWILSGACGLKDNRIRSKEFDSENNLSKEELVNLLKRLSQDLAEYVPQLAQKSFTEIRKVQCYEESVLSILIHAIEHFSYHTGQIVCITKSIKNIDCAFYGKDLLDETN